MSLSPITKLTLLPALTAVLIAVLCGSAAAQQHITGTLPDDATYVIDVPAPWNGALLLYSHGYVDPGSPNPALDVSDPYTGGYMLAAGYALAGSSYASTGWAVHEAIPDQIATLDVFQSMVGTPLQTIAWGHSMGGEVTAALRQEYPDRFDAALPMCGVLAGSVGFWNQHLDGAFAFNTLLAGGSLQVVNITNPTLNLGTAEAILAAAQTTAQGQARIALVAALEDLPGWYDPTTPEPAPTDYTTQQANQFLWLQNDALPTAFAARAELEFRAGGNPSFNTGVNYERQLARSANYAEVQALYAAAGLSLHADLAMLKSAPRIAADPGALTYLSDNVIFNGQITVPVLTLHTTGDGVVSVEEERAYTKVVHEANDSKLLIERFVHRAGHCEFSPAEMITAEQMLERRLATGKWEGFGISQLNTAAAALGPEFNIIDVNNAPYPAAPAFMEFQPLQFLRLYDVFTQ
jgi:pimeloyl-ACP methyl ester carboxylesterase